MCPVQCFFLLFAEHPENFSYPLGGKNALKNFRAFGAIDFKSMRLGHFGVCILTEAGIFCTFHPCFFVFAAKNNIFSKDFAVCTRRRRKIFTLFALAF